MTEITLNGEAYQVHESATIADLLTSLELDAEKVAIERNLEILPHSLFENTAITEGDALEIVHFIGGG